MIEVQKDYYTFCNYERVILIALSCIFECQTLKETKLETALHES